jgi:hypothetical protein
MSGKIKVTLERPPRLDILLHLPALAKYAATLEQVGCNATEVCNALTPELA